MLTYIHNPFAHSGGGLPEVLPREQHGGGRLDTERKKRKGENVLRVGELVFQAIIKLAKSISSPSSFPRLELERLRCEPTKAF